MPFLLLAVPALLAVLALRNKAVPLRVSVALVDGIVVLLAFSLLPVPRPSSLLVAAALGVSSVGDYFLATRGTQAARFAAGVGAFLLAHVGFLVFALLQGGMDWPVLAVLAAGIALLMLSDTLIALREFLGRKKPGWLILPTYSLSHLAVAASMLAWGLGPRV